MNYRKQIKLALIALVMILCTQGKPAAAKAPKIPVVATEINGKQALDASGSLQRSKKPGTKKNFQKKIFYYLILFVKCYKFSKKNIYRRLLQSHVTRRSGWI